MAISEIDDIFSGKVRSVAPSKPTLSSSTSTSTSKAMKKKMKRREKEAKLASTSTAAPSTEPAPPPESSSSSLTSSTAKKSKKKRKHRDVERDDDEQVEERAGADEWGGFGGDRNDGDNADTRPATNPMSTKHKKSSKKHKVAGAVAVDDDNQAPAREPRPSQPPIPPQRIPETIIDTSNNLLSLPSSVGSLKSSKLKLGKTAKAKAKTGKDEGLDRFKDSRGSSNRKTTEEGYAVYKENELGIGDEGGDTPDCPFDCNCCF